MVSRVPPDSRILPDTVISDLLMCHPQLRPVLDKHGMRGCGGRAGPYETISFFARAHDVEESKLILELELALESRSGQDSFQSLPACITVADTIYKRFFLCGIGVILSLGATWGAWLLWRVGVAGSFTGVTVHEVNAHGQAQVFGWMGLFMMGFAYQAFPRFWNTSLFAPQAAVFACNLMVAGILAASLGMVTAQTHRYALLITEIGSLLEVVAVSIFAWQIFATWKQSKRVADPHVVYVFTAICWFLLMSVFNAWHNWNVTAAGTKEALLFFVSTFQAPLRDAQFHGLAMTMIFGVSLRTLPSIFGFEKVSDKKAWLALGLLTASVVSEIVLFIAYRLSHNHVLAGLLMIPWMGLLTAAGILVLSWKLFQDRGSSDRSMKYIRAAFVWLLVSLVMLLLLPVYQILSHQSFSHAYYGATRHAITVGFISLMIMGYALKVTPILNGIDTSKLGAQWGPFLLVNAGCLLRVSTQILTDWSPVSFAVVGLSGIMEVAGLAWWSAHLFNVIRLGQKCLDESELLSASPQSAGDRPVRIEGEHFVAQVLAWYPETETVFVRFGFTPVLNPFMRRTLASQVTLNQACKMKQVGAEEFLLALNSSIETCDSDCRSCACSDKQEREI